MSFWAFIRISAKKYPLCKHWKFWLQFLMGLSTLAVNTNDQCGTRGLELFFKDVILQSCTMAVNSDPDAIWSCSVYMEICRDLALLFALPTNTGSFLLLPVQLRPNHKYLIKPNIRPIYSCAEFSTNFQCFLINRLVVRLQKSLR